MLAIALREKNKKNKSIKYQYKNTIRLYSNRKNKAKIHVKKNQINKFYFEIRDKSLIYIYIYIIIKILTILIIKHLQFVILFQLALHISYILTL